jgi:hypothetical protein
MRTFYDPAAALRWLLPGLQRLDALLGQRAVAAATAHGAPQGSDPYRGLYVSPAEVDRLLAHPPGAPPFGPFVGDPATPLAEPCPPGSPMGWLAEAHSLSSFDVDVLLLVLAPELDLRYERLYAYLQDDVTRRRPSVDLALNVVCGSVDEKLAHRANFAPDAPLFHHRLVWSLAEPVSGHVMLLGQVLKLDDQIANLLLGLRIRDQRLAPLCVGRRVEAEPGEEAVDPSLDGLAAAAERASARHRAFALHLRGGAVLVRRRAAERLARRLERELLHLDLTRPSDVRRDDLLRVAVREAWLQDQLLYLDGLDAGVDGRPWEVLLASLDRLPVPVLLAGADDWRPPPTQGLGLIAVDVGVPGAGARAARWTERAAAAGVPLAPADAERLAGTFQLDLDQIADAVAAAEHRAARPAPDEGGATFDDLAAAAREQARHDLRSLAIRITPAHTWKQLVLPDDALTQLRELCARVRHRQQVLGAWGFERRLTYGYGVTALFAGPSGTGKTMAAEVIAADLGIELYKIDLAGVVSKYIGETEKNLERIFSTAEHANAILFFDEADALFGKRSEVRDSHDRYANIETAYLLQRMEKYSGIAILATNMRGNLDEAFTRRIAFTVLFPFPEDDERRRIWEDIWPSDVPRDPKLKQEFKSLASRFRLSGGQISNAALAAAFLAVEARDVVRVPHVLHAISREYEKMGHTLSGDELHAGGPATIQ